MNHFILIFISLLLSQWGVAQSTFEGRLPLGEGTTYQVYLKEIDLTAHATDLIEAETAADSKGRFSFRPDIKQGSFFNISIVAQFADGRKSNRNTIVYLRPRKKLKIDFIQEQKYTVKADYTTLRDKDNKALLQVQDRLSQMELSLYDKTFDPIQTKENIGRFYTISDSILSQSKADPIVEKYIRFYSFDKYNAALYRFGMDAGKKAGINLKTYYQQPVSAKPFFNDPLLIGFYTGISSIINYLDLSIGLKPYTRSKSLDQIAQQYAVLDSMVTQPVVKDLVLDRLLSNYVSSYRAGDDFNVDLNSYGRVAQNIQDSSIRQENIQAFQNLRYTLVGSPAVDLQFQTPAGETVTLDQFKGKYVFIDVWASWCVPCIQMIPHLQKLEHDYKGQNIEFIALSIDGDQKKWLDKVQQLKLEGNQIWDPKGQFSKLMNISGIPHYLLYDTAGKLIAYKVHAPNDPQLRIILDKLLK